MDGREMMTFEVFVHDDRYSVPTLHLMALAGVAMARSAAEALLKSSAHYLGVELCHDGEQILTLGDCPTRSRTNEAELKVASAG